MLAPNLKRTLGTMLGTGEKRGDVGIELETEGERLPIEVTSWNVKHEGSLRGKNGRVVAFDEPATDAPREYVSRGPFQIDTVRAKVELLQTAFKEAKSTVNLTDRASTHIHLNLSREPAQTFLALLLVYVAIEPVLLRICGERRNGNLFCIPTYETWDLPRYAQQVAEALSYSEPRHRWPQRGKYGSINPDPLTNLGSVEVRCFPNTFDPETIQGYANWLVNIRTLAASMEPPFDQELNRFWRDPQSLLSAVFGTTVLGAACRPHNPANLVMFGLEQAHEIREGFEPVFNWTEDTKTRGKTPGASLFEDDITTLERLQAVQPVIRPWNVDETVDLD